ELSSYQLKLLLLLLLLLHTICSHGRATPCASDAWRHNVRNPCNKLSTACAEPMIMSAATKAGVQHGWQQRWCMMSHKLLCNTAAARCQLTSEEATQQPAHLRNIRAAALVCCSVSHKVLRPCSCHAALYKKHAEPLLDVASNQLHKQHAGLKRLLDFMHKMKLVICSCCTATPSLTFAAAATCTCRPAPYFKGISSLSIHLMRSSLDFFLAWPYASRFSAGAFLCCHIGYAARAKPSSVSTATFR
ncbi:hypothetical protein COO60DRAFT_1555947, partial [Scenedesmus sp. NREL 46B-D3]